jgi:uncharacterized MAPEG superfamily protein
MASETLSGNEGKAWKKFLRNHWKTLVVMILAVAIVVIGAVYVLQWFATNAQQTGLVPKLLGAWSMGHVIAFILNLILWEVLFVGIPVIVVALLFYFGWWKRIPHEEREEYRRGHLFGKRSRRSDGGNAVSFLFFIAFVIKVYIDGNWNVPIATLTFNYVVSSVVWILIWILVIFGIPLAIGGSLWLRHELNKKP